MLRNYATTVVQTLQLERLSGSQLSLKLSSITTRYNIIFQLDIRHLFQADVTAINQFLTEYKIGQPISTPQLREFCNRIRQNVQIYEINGPYRPTGSDVQTIRVNPMQSPCREPGENIIIETTLGFAGDGGIVISGTNRRRRGHVVKFIPFLEDYSLRDSFECDLLRGFLFMLSCGNALHEELFYSNIRTVHNMNYDVNLDEGLNGIGRWVILCEIRTRRPHEATSSERRTGPRQPQPIEQPRRQHRQQQPRQLPPQREIRRVNNFGIDYPGVDITGLLSEAGGQACVYKGRFRNQDVAVKVFSGASEMSWYSTELSCLMSLRHRNVVRIINCFTNPRPAIVMEFVNGTNLSDFLHNHGQFNQPNGVRVIFKIILGIQHLHENDIVHRDLKTLNIMLRSGSLSPVIIDFGISAEFMNNHSTPCQGSEYRRDFTQIQGTPSWMSPEMITTGEYSMKTDIYALGLIMYSIFSGRIPFEATSDANHPSPLIPILEQIARGDRPTFSSVSHIEPWLHVLIQKCWSQNPQDRPDIEEVLDAVLFNDLESLFLHYSQRPVTSNNMAYENFARFCREKVGIENPDEVHSIYERFSSGTREITFQNFRRAWEFIKETYSFSTL